MENKLHAKAFVVWFICALFFLYEFLLRTVIGTYELHLVRDLSLNAFEFSLLSTTIFFVIYGSMQIPAGIIIDKFGLKKSLFFAAIVCALSSFLFSHCHHYSEALFCRTLMGFGASFGFLCLLVSVHDWMPRKYQAIFIGLSQFIGTLGPMAAAGPLESLSMHGGVTWRITFSYLGVFGFILSILVFLFVENNRQKKGQYVILYKSEKALNSVKSLFKRSQPWWIAIFSAVIYFTVEYLSENEGRSFLMLKGISEGSSAYMITLSWLGYAIGCPLLGFFSDLLERRKSVMIASAIIALFSIVAIVYAKHRLLLQVAFFLLGLSATGQSVGFATTVEYFKKQFVAVGFSLNNAFITVFSAMSAPLIGWMLDKGQSHGSLGMHDYHRGFLILIAMAIVSIIVSVFFIRETYCKSKVGFTVTD